MKTTINGKEYEFEIDGAETAVEIIRDKVGLTGTKLVCGQGVCGACTVLIDGVPSVSCLCPGQQLEGKKVETVEVHAREKLHPVQQAFMACDGLQCGFCTPGFINASVAFYDEWRKEYGKKEPSRHEIAKAMSGHLCRCGAYTNIYDAIQQACTGEFDQGEIQEFPRIEAREKVMGSAKYTADIQLKGQLVGKILRSPYAHAKVTDLDASKVGELEGTFAAIGLLPKDNVVRYIGQEIAAVAAVDEVTAQNALQQFKVDYEVKKGVASIEMARMDGTTLVWGEGKKNPPNASEGPIVPGRWKGNVRMPKVNLVSKWARAAQRRINKAETNGLDYLEEGVWRTSAQIHTALEPHVCIADWSNKEKLVVYLSTQAVYNMATEIAKKFKLDRNQVEVHADYIGGAFGAKIGLTQEAVAAIKLSRAAEAPVKVMLSRAEEMENGGYRPPAEIQLALVANKEQKLEALQAHAYTNSGIGINTMVATLMRLIYPAGAKDLIDYDVVTNLASGKPFRGPSAPLTCWALEQAIDGIAEKMEVDPIALRKKWDKHKLRQKLYDWAAELPIWKNRKPAGNQKGRFRRGVGVAMGNWLHMYQSNAEVVVKASSKGIEVSTACQDMGNGSRTVLAKAVAEIFGISPNEVQVNIGDSSKVIGPSSNGSRTTPSLYAPAKEAAQKVKAALEIQAEDKLKLRDAYFLNGQLHHANGFFSFQDFLQQINPVAGHAKRGTNTFIDLLALLPMGDVDMGKGFSGSVCVAEVEVDTLLGKTKVLNIWNGLAVGEIIVPELALSQCYGAIAQGVGYALYEERVVDSTTCNVLTLGLEEYKIAGIGDIPEITIHFEESGFDHVKGKAIGLAEIAKIPIAASIGNAVYNATGWQPKHMPIRPDLVVQGVNSIVRKAKKVVPLNLE